MTLRFVLALSLYIVSLLITVYGLTYHSWENGESFMMLGLSVFIVGFMVNIYAVRVGYLEGLKRGRYSGWWKGSVLLLIISSLVVVLTTINIF